MWSQPESPRQLLIPSRLKIHLPGCYRNGVRIDDCPYFRRMGEASVAGTDDPQLPALIEAATTLPGRAGARHMESNHMACLRVLKTSWSGASTRSGWSHRK